MCLPSRAVVCRRINLAFPALPYNRPQILRIDAVHELHVRRCVCGQVPCELAYLVQCAGPPPAPHAMALANRVYAQAVYANVGYEVEPVGPNYSGYEFETSDYDHRQQAAPYLVTQPLSRCASHVE